MPLGHASVTKTFSVNNASFVDNARDGIMLALNFFGKSFILCQNEMWPGVTTRNKAEIIWKVYITTYNLDNIFCTAYIDFQFLANISTIHHDEKPNVLSYSANALLYTYTITIWLVSIECLLQMPMNGNLRPFVCQW